MDYSTARIRVGQMTLTPLLNMTGALFSMRPGLVPPDETEWEKFGFIAPRVLDVVGWTLLTLRSETPLLEEHLPPQQHYLYEYLMRRRGERFLLVSTHAALVETLLDVTGLRKAVTCPTIDVTGLVSELAAKPARYSMSAVFARVEGFGHALRTIRLVGSDLGDAKLFLDILPYLIPHRVNLRDVSTRTEVLSASVRGEIGFVYGGPAALRDCDRALAFLSQRQYLSWDVESERAGQGQSND